jgi:hypothetical protein
MFVLPTKPTVLSAKLGLSPSIVKPSMTKRPFLRICS